MISEANFNDICRACLKKCVNMRHITHIDAKSPGQLTVMSLLMHCASVQVNDGDGLPQQVCINCILHMGRFLALKQMVIKSDAILRDILESKHKHPEIETIYVDGIILSVKDEHNGVEEELIFSNVTDVLLECNTVENENPESGDVAVTTWECRNKIGDISLNNDNEDLPHMNNHLPSKATEQNEFSEHNIDKERTEDVQSINENLPAPVDNEEKDVTDCELVPNAAENILIDHSYFNNDEGENIKKEKVSYSCSLCSRKFPNNRKFHQHSSRRHPVAYSYTYLQNLLNAETPPKDTIPLDKNATTTENPEKPEDSNLKIYNTPDPEDEIFKEPLPRIKKPRKKQLKNYSYLKNLLKEETPPKDTIPLDKNATTEENPEKTEGSNAQTCNSPDPEDEIFKQPLPRIKKPRKKPLKTCLICGKILKSSTSFIIHMQSHTGERPHMCHLCGSTYTQRSHLRMHQLMHTGEKKFVCDVCGKRFLNITYLKKHMESHMERNHSCTKCPKAYQTQKQLDLHIRIVHKGERPFKCPFAECSNVYSSAITLNNHLESKHPNTANVESRKPYNCTKCARSFSRQTFLDRHMSVHTEHNDRRDCKFCGKVFSSRMGLRNHSVRHGASRGLQCHICNRSFSDELKLKSHVRFHARPKPHECETCHRKFVDKSALVVHMRTHTGEKPYKCDTCDKRFTVKKSLQAHLNNHKGIFPFDCMFCEKKFVGKGLLNTHLLTVHNFG